MMNRLIFIVLASLCPLFLVAQTDLITFSRQGGFYENSFSLSLGCSEGNHIRYTVNGSTPTADATLYQEPLFLDKVLYSKSNIYTIVNCIPSIFYAVDSVERAIVIRAAVFDANDNCVSPVVTNSYFIKSLGCDLHGLPVLSIVTDSLALFDYETGIFVPGINYDPTDSLRTGNYYQKGREWEREINMEFYEPDNQGINQQCGLRIHGGASRFFQQKGMRLYAREEYGKKRFTHRFFDTTPIVKFKHLNLHPFRCSNWLQTGGQEYLAQNIASNLNIDCLAVRQTVVFINGEYWGIYTLEESPDERYLEDHFNVDLDEVNLLKYWGVPDYGDPSEWQGFYSWMHTADLTQPEDSAYAYMRMDVPGFIDYVLFESFSANLDWPQNNVRIWQPATGQPFRCLFYDGDGCFSWYWYDALENLTNSGGNSVIFNRFYENEGFCKDLYERYLQLKNTYLGYDYMKEVLERYHHIVEGEIEKQAERFSFPDDLDRWYTDMEKTDEFLQLRYSYYETEWGWFDVDDNTVQKPLLTCYPNPSMGGFAIGLNAVSSGESVIEMFDSKGQKVYAKQVVSHEGMNRVVIDEQLPAGLYVVRVNSMTQRIIIL
jgi:hypothetical protein